MSADVVEQLRSLTRSFDEFVGEVTADEVMGEHTNDEGRARRWTQVAAAVIVLALVGGLAALMQQRDAGGPADGETLSGAALADAIVDRVWVAIDYPLPQLPFMRLSDGDGSAGVELIGSDGCNSNSGPFRLDGNTIAGSQIMSTLIGCTTPRIAGLWDGSTMTLDGGALTVTDSSGTSTRWLALDALSPIAPTELVGTYTMGTTAVSVTPDAVVTDDCTRTWVADGPVLRFTGAACTASAFSAYSLLNPPEWTSAVGDDVRVVVQVDGRFVRLDRTDADAPERPGLASFLGAIGDRTWVYDAPLPDYPLARRPSLRPPTSWDEIGGQVVAGFDGCNAYALNGSWAASGEGWQAAVADGGGTSVGCGDRPTVTVTNGSVLSLTPDGLLSVAAPDGTEYLFRDIRAATLGDMLQSPIAELPGRWELDPGIVVDIKLGTSADGIGVITFGTCGVNWWPTGNEWIGADPVPADCVPPADSPSAAAFLQLLDTGAAGGTAAPDERPITVGVNPDRDALYLANDDGSTVLRLTLVDAASPDTVGEPADAMTINRPFVDPSICSPLAASESGWAEVILQPFAIGTDGPIAMQVFADPTLGPDGPFALLLRYRDRPEYLDVPDELVDVNGWQVGLRTLQPGTTEATWDLADGGRAYLRARDLDRETIVALVESLQVREKSADVAGFDIRGDRPLGASISMVAEHMNTGLAARGATFACTTPDTSIWRVSAIDADPIAAYTFALDRPRPLDVEVVGNTLILVGGPQSFVDRPLVRASDVVNADPATWQDLLGQPMP